jgi:hypothetical protein
MSRRTAATGSRSVYPAPPLLAARVAALSGSAGLDDRNIVGVSRSALRTLARRSGKIAPTDVESTSMDSPGTNSSAIHMPTKSCMRPHPTAPRPGYLPTICRHPARAYPSHGLHDVGAECRGRAFARKTTGKPRRSRPAARYRARTITRADWQSRSPIPAQTRTATGSSSTAST